MRFKLLAALLMLVPAPALADVTATYSVAGQTLTVESEDHGNSRVSFGDKLTIIRRDGVDYAMVRGVTGGWSIARADDLLATVRAQLQGAHPPRSATDPRVSFALTQGAAETVANYPGMVWTIAPVAAAGAGKPAGRQVDVVLSADPAIAPVGGVFQHLIDTLATVALPMMGDTDFVTRVDELFAKGAPIRVGPFLKLASVSTAEIPDDHFALPGPVLGAAAFLEAVDPSKAGAALPPAP